MVQDTSNPQVQTAEKWCSTIALQYVNAQGAVHQSIHDPNPNEYNNDLYEYGHSSALTKSSAKTAWARDLSSTKRRGCPG